MRTAQLVQRFGTPEEIGKAVMFLLSDDCRFMTGSLISVDGGFVCQ
jgi:NAD(P)-dependent dehydrogenase (short-subunit alcohol dehydrogenase family)